MKKLIIATRASRLALWQAEYIAGLVVSVYPGCAVELLKIKTRGDVMLDTPLAKVGGKGLFVKEIEDALLDGRADLAVHSMKDVPSVLPDGLMLGVITKRADAEDLFLSEKFESLDELPTGAVLGTSSLRRQAQALALRPDLEIKMLRGNVDTRLNKLKEGQYDAIILAAAGVKRLGLAASCMSILPPEIMLPAAGQGALGLEYRTDRPELHELLKPFEDADTRHCVNAERAFTKELGGSCQIPAGAYARITTAAHGVDSPQLTLTGLVGNPDGTKIIRDSITAPKENALALGAELSHKILNAGGAVILHELGLTPGASV